MSTATATKPANSKSDGQFPPRAELSFWKPNKSKKGHVAHVQFSPAQEGRAACFFLSFAPESGKDSPKFDNDKMIKAKLGLNDVGEILAVLVGQTNGLGQINDSGYWSGLFHKSPSGQSVIGLDRGKADSGSFFLSLSATRDGENIRMSIPLTPGEMQQLRCFLECYIKDMFLS